MDVEEQHTYTRFLTQVNNKADAESTIVSCKHFVHADASALAESEHCRCVFEVQIPFSNVFGFFHTNYQLRSSSGSSSSGAISVIASILRLSMPLAKRNCMGQTASFEAPGRDLSIFAV